eukprot:12378662-Heterocapsa_arctica.AAC.1
MVSVCLPCPEGASTNGAVNVSGIEGCQCRAGTVLEGRGPAARCSLCVRGTYAGQPGLSACEAC